MSILSAAGGFVICSRCGYENDDVSKACYHCKAALPAAEEPHEQEVQGGEPEVAGEQAAVAGDGIVEEEIKQGLLYLEQGNVETARLFFRNAAALNIVRGADGRSDISDRIVLLLKRCENRPALRRRECAVCGGEGKVKAESPALAGGPARLGPPGRKCSACAGSGYTAWRGTVDDRKYLRGRAMARYAMLQQARKLVPLGGAWLPAGMVSELSVHERVRIKRALAAQCEECLAFGRVDCRDCKGVGRVECPERDCVNGYVTTEDSGGLSKSKMRQTRKCTACRGNRYIACNDCTGQGSLLCSECNGTGERSTCKRCGGEGLRACRRCSGSGMHKKLTCDTCMGAGVAECSSCNGDGKR